MDSSRGIILYNPDNNEFFTSNEEKIKQIAEEIDEILKNKTLSEDEIIKILKGEL